jgi:hypothetical protein
MNIKDYIGKRGEIIFPMLITKWCEGKPWFDPTFLGEKTEAKDFLVNLIRPESGDAHFFVQVKATRNGYTGTGPDEKLTVQVTKADIAKLKKVPAPTYVVGIDIVKECGFIIAITNATTGSISGITTRFRINCRVIKALWKEVDAYWKARKMLAATSRFSP